jgi:hypothetical protein
VLQYTYGADQDLVYHLFRNRIVFIAWFLLKHVTAHQKINNRGVKVPGQLEVKFRNVGRR